MRTRDDRSTRRPTQQRGGASLRPSGFLLDGPLPDVPLTLFRPIGERDDRLSVSLPMTLHYAIEAIAPARKPPGFVSQWALARGLNRLRDLPETSQIAEARETIVQHASTYAMSDVDDWRLPGLFPGKRQKVSLRNVDPRVIGRTTKLREVLGLDSLAAVAIAVGLVDVPGLPPGLAHVLSAELREFMAALRSRAALMDELAKRARLTPVEKGPQPTWPGIVEQRK